MRKILILVGVVLLVATGMNWVAQGQPIQSVEAEERFQVALDAFESGNYQYAFHFFKDTYKQSPMHTKTTAAYLMAGKSLHRHGDHVAAMELLEEFMVRYPSSSYREEASRLIATAQQALRDIQVDEDAIRIGLALPLSPDRFTGTRSMFRGILLAVDAYNSQNERKVKLFFRDTENSTEGAYSAVSSLLDEDVSVIIGPFSSENVDAVAGMAEQNRVVLIAPMATSASLTEGRNYVFQVNASLENRGRSIARQAIEYLSLTEIGIVTEAGNNNSEEMAQGFIAELRKNGLTPKFTYEVESLTDWSRLSQLIDQDKLTSVEGIYFSVYDNISSTSSLIQDAINGVTRTGTRPYFLGPSIWQPINLSGLGSEVAVYNVDVHYRNENRLSVRKFIYAYKESNQGAEPDPYAYIGYDVAEMLLQNLEKDGILVNRLLSAPQYEGVTMRIKFGANQRNTALYLFEHMRHGLQVIR